MKRRITEAKALLTSTDFSLTQIAKQIGFGSLAYFSKCFHKIESISPNEYRKTAKKKAPDQPCVTLTQIGTAAQQRHGYPNDTTLPLLCFAKFIFSEVLRLVSCVVKAPLVRCFVCLQTRCNPKEASPCHNTKKVSAVQGFSGTADTFIIGTYAYSSMVILVITGISIGLFQVSAP